MNNRIHALRKSRQMSMQQLADAVGTTASTINRLEKGQRRLTVEWMQRLAEILNVPPYDLVEHDIVGLSENAEPYIPPTDGPLQSLDHYSYMRMSTDDLEEHPDGIAKGTIICFDLNKSELRKISACKVVLASLMDKEDLATQHGSLVGSFMPPNKIASNKASDNWIVSIDDPSYPFEIIIRGVMRFVLRETNS